MPKPTVTEMRHGPIYLYRSSDGWHYDGPASCGPRHVRRSGRGPYWRGPVSPQFAGVLIRKIRAIKETPHA